MSTSSNTGRGPNRAGTVLAAALALLAGVAEVGMAYESAYPRTGVGVIEVKTLPAATVMSAGMRDGDRNAAFRDLFRYIQDRKVPMTVPVELEQGTNSAMRFYLNRSLTNNLPAPSETVALAARTERTVVSLGLRGSYSEKHYSEALTRLAQWMTQHPEWAVAGDAYQVFWNGPFVPSFIKRSEVHLPVRKDEAGAGEPGER